MSRSYGVVLVPSAALSAGAIEISEKLRTYKSHFTLGGNGPFPHMSLYMIHLSDDALGVAIKRLADLARNTPPLQLDAIRHSYVRGYVDVEYEKADVLASLQDRVIEVTHSLRDTSQPTQQPHRSIEAENIEKYGYGLVGDLFRPHITFTKLTSDDLDILELLGEPDQFDGMFSHIGIFELGKHGTCIRQIETFDMTG